MHVKLHDFGFLVHVSLSLSQRWRTEKMAAVKTLTGGGVVVHVRAELRSLNIHGPESEWNLQCS